MSATRYLDDYTDHYEDCAQKWQNSAEMAKSSPALASRLLDMLEKGEMTTAGKNCPALRREHAQALKTELTLLTTR